MDTFCANHGGTKQRLGSAQAMLNDPCILILSIFLINPDIEIYYQYNC